MPEKWQIRESGEFRPRKSAIRGTKFVPICPFMTLFFPLYMVKKREKALHISLNPTEDFMLFSKCGIYRRNIFLFCQKTPKCPARMLGNRGKCLFSLRFCYIKSRKIPIFGVFPVFQSRRDLAPGKVRVGKVDFMTFLLFLSKTYVFSIGFVLDNTF